MPHLHLLAIFVLPSDRFANDQSKRPANEEWAQAEPAPGCAKLKTHHQTERADPDGPSARRRAGTKPIGAQLRCAIAALDPRPTQPYAGHSSGSVRQRMAMT